MGRIEKFFRLDVKKTTRLRSPQFFCGMGGRAAWSFELEILGGGYLRSQWVKR